MTKIFTMRCISPTPTFKEGKRYTVVEFNRGDYIGRFINENGNSIAVWAKRFTDLQIEEIKEDMKLKCINSKFKNITIGKTYTVVEDLGAFVLVKNDKNIKAKYSKKYFESEDDAPKRVPREKVDQFKCVIPNKDLTYGKTYKLTPIKGDGEHVNVINNNGETIKVLKKRFAKK